MAISLKLHDTNGVSVVTASGRLTLGAETNELRDMVKGLLASGHTKLVLNLNKLEYIDSSGLGTLVGLQTSAGSAGGHIKLTRPTGRLHELLVMTRLLTVFDIYDTEEAAVVSFGTAASA